VGVSRLLHGILFGLRTVDAISFLSMSLLLLVIALLAAYSPARGASSIPTSRSDSSEASVQREWETVREDRTRDGTSSAWIRRDSQHKRRSLPFGRIHFNHAADRFDTISND